MTYHIENNHFDLAMELLIENGFDGVAVIYCSTMNSSKGVHAKMPVC